MANMLSLFQRKDTKSECAEPVLHLSRANFNYPIGYDGFKSFFYRFDIALPFRESQRVIAAQRGVERVSNLIEKNYSGEKGFIKRYSGEISSDKREISMKYGGGNGIFGELANLDFSAVVDGDKIKEAYFFLHLYGITKEDILATHDAIIGLPNLKVSYFVKSTLEQIAQLRAGKGPRVENLLLS